MLSLIPVQGLPLIGPGDSVADLVVDTLGGSDKAFQAGDVLVVAQKVISKAEGRIVRLAEVEPSPEAIRLGEQAGVLGRLLTGGNSPW